MTNQAGRASKANEDLPDHYGTVLVLEYGLVVLYLVRVQMFVGSSAVRILAVYSRARGRYAEVLYDSRTHAVLTTRRRRKLRKLIITQDGVTQSTCTLHVDTVS